MEIPIPTSSNKIDHSQKVYFTGSCFSENVANKFKYFGFDLLSNSHGIIYNPVSISECFFDLMNPGSYQEKDLSFHNDNYFSYAHHGCFDGKESSEVIKNINVSLQLHASFIKAAQVVFITLGTAWVYVQREINRIVANCHKVPAEFFKKRLLTVDDIENNLEKMIDRIHFLNPAAQIVFTLSPVKHLKDGFVENQLSKSRLHVAIHNFLSKNVSYFPSYEIMNDDLRDYRFWKEDMMHPNELAIEYIWQKFSETYFSKETMEVMKEVKQYQQLASHRPLSPNLGEIKDFDEKKKAKLIEIKNKYPQLIL